MQEQAPKHSEVKRTIYLVPSIDAQILATQKALGIESLNYTINLMLAQGLGIQIDES